MHIFLYWRYANSLIVFYILCRKREIFHKERNRRILDSSIVNSKYLNLNKLICLIIGLELQWIEGQQQERKSYIFSCRVGRDHRYFISILCPKKYQDLNYNFKTSRMTSKSENAMKSEKLPLSAMKKDGQPAKPKRRVRFDLSSLNYAPEDMSKRIQPSETVLSSRAYRIQGSSIISNLYY